MIDSAPKIRTEDDQSDRVRHWITDKTHRQWAYDLLAALCEVDTSTTSDIDALQASEKKCFEIYRKALAPFTNGSHDWLFPAINPAILEDDDYTLPRYAGEQYQNFQFVYGKRTNLLLRQNRYRSNDRPWLLHAHVDTVPPHMPVRCFPERIAARGAADDKASMVVIALVLRWLNEAGKDCDELPWPPVDVAVTIDEETGGNGSLSLATTTDCAASSIVVMEPTRLKPHPANRGALWFQVCMKAARDIDDPSIAAISVEVIKEIFLLGRRLQKEKAHPLFLPLHVQTCIGMWGPWGKFPSTACERVEFVLEPEAGQGLNASRLKLLLNDLLVKQARQYGLAIKKGVKDVYPIGTAEKPAYRVVIEAVSGHMGSLSRDSDAAVKAAFLISAIAAENIGNSYPPMGDRVIIEGGQGFTPSHRMNDIADRIKKAVFKGHQRAVLKQGLVTGAMAPTISFDKIHNKAFCSDLAARGSKLINEAAAAFTGNGEPPALAGWEASCDARIFARQSKDVTTFGPGSLDAAHSPDESIAIDEIMTAAGILFHAISRSPAQ